MSKKTLESPIFALYIIGDNIIVASGGGDKKFGVKNKLLLYNIKMEIFQIQYSKKKWEMIFQCT